MLQRLVHSARELGGARLDVLWAVAKTLDDAHRHVVVANLNERAVQPVATPRLRLDAEQPDGRAEMPVVGPRVAKARTRGDCQGARIRGLHEPWLADQNGRPGPARAVEAADDHEGQFSEKLAMLVRHEVTDGVPSGPLGAPQAPPQVHLERRREQRGAGMGVRCRDGLRRRSLLQWRGYLHVDAAVRGSCGGSVYRRLRTDLRRELGRLHRRARGDTMHGRWGHLHGGRV